jgi:uncharacterized protein with HEPN domain
MSFEPREYLRHILAEADYLLASRKNLSREDFLGDETLKRAFVRSLEIIGEAAKKLPDDFRAGPGGGMASDGRHAGPANPRVISVWTTI